MPKCVSFLSRLCSTIKKAANKFITSVHSYVNSSRGIVFYNGEGFEGATIAQFNGNLILEDHYTPREEDRESPNDSPVWNVEISSMDCSSVTSNYGEEDPVYKYQRIETPLAFARSIPEGVHIFPKVKCFGEHKWLDQQEFNRLALSGPGHQQYVGTGRGHGKRAKTTPKVAIASKGTSSVSMENRNFTRIQIWLWCKNREVPEAWQPFLPNNATLHDADGHCCFQNLFIYCETNRRAALLFEDQQNPDDTVTRKCVTAIPGVADPTSL